MSRSPSEEFVPCAKTLDSKDTEAVFSAQLLPPLYITAGYLVVLRAMSNSLVNDIQENPDADPFKNVWWSGPIIASVLYLMLIYFGKKYMQTREPFPLRPYIFTYNLYQCILNAWCVGAFIYEVYSNPWYTSVWGNYPQPGPAGFRISFLVWVHYINKYVELLDTTFMILRKKNNQVSFLHCYHHVLLIWAWFMVCKVEARGDSYFGATVNSFIHVVMYGYYTLALLNIPCPWKKWITNLQMLQFATCLGHSFYVMYVGNSPWILPAGQAFVMVNMLVLFGNFYVQTYMKKKNAKDGRGKDMNQPGTAAAVAGESEKDTKAKKAE